ncbi:hypothetical protein [Geodermatophilus sp. SYSU D00815]
MSLSDLVPSVRDALTVRRVFGEPYERDGVTVIPAAVVRGGGGGGSGRQGGEQEGEGEGGGFGLIARPAGAYVVKDGEVAWQPAVDVNRIVATAVAGWVAVAWLVSRALRGRRPVSS